MNFPLKSFRELSCDILQIYLVNNKAFEYRAGQYVELLLPDEAPRPFSIASAPHHEYIEFHIKHVADNLYAKKLVHYIKHNKILELKGPYGKLAYHPTPRLPLLFIAAGTGFAPCKAIIEEALTDKDHAPIYLYWAARKQEDLYWHEKLVELQQEIAHFHYVPVLSSLGKERIYDVVLKDHPDVSHFHVYASGPEEMVLTAQQKFSYPPHFYSDWLDYGK